LRWRRCDFLIREYNSIVKISIIPSLFPNKMPDIKNTHNQKKWQKGKQRYHHSDEPLAKIALYPPPKTTPAIQTRFSKSNASKK
jgi:hypothetical protein